MDGATRAFYDAWKAQHIASGCGAGRRYVSVRGDVENAISVSEGHGYGMMITVLMAGHDPEARTIFDGLCAFFEDHQSTLTEHLMAWKQSPSCADVEGSDSATDGDMDIAYALLLADRQWGSAGAVDYRGQAIATINAIMEKDINKRTFHPTLGDWATADEAKYFYATRTSDFMAHHWKAYAAASGDARWTKVVDSTYALVSRMKRKYSPTTGLLPDFIQNTNTTPRPAAKGFLEGSADGRYSYNACRDPWRLGTDYLLSGDPRSRATVGKINAWIRKKTANDPRRIYDGYRLTGESISNSNESAFVAPLGVGAMVGAENQAWLNSIWNLEVRRPLRDDSYYSSTLKLLAMITMSGNWWGP